jgi:hypothetical protein
MTTYRRKRTSDATDQYLDVDDILKDGEYLHVPAILADAQMVNTVRAAHPPRMRYGRGYLSDVSGHIIDARGTITDPVKEGGANWPSANVGLVSYWQHQIGEPCECPDGSPGRLTPHPNQSSMYCKPLSEDAATVDSTAAYYAMKDAAQHEWKRYGPRRDSCCGTCADQLGTIGHIGPEQTWPQQQRQGAPCSINGQPGRLEDRNGAFVCVPDQAIRGGNRGGDSTVINRGQQAAVGDPCGPDGSGRMVRRNGQLVCEPAEDFDHRTVDGAEAIRERAWRQSVIDAGTEYLRWK